MAYTSALLRRRSNDPKVQILLSPPPKRERNNPLRLLENDKDNLLSDPRMQINIRQHVVLPSKHLRVRFPNGLGLSIIPDPINLLRMSQTPMLPGTDTYEAAVIKFNSSDWDDLEIVDHNEGIFQYLEKEELFSLMAQIETLPPDFF